MDKLEKDRICLIKGDITKLDTDAIVNAANNSLLGGGGVDGAIHKAGGKQILEECIAIRDKQGGCKTGEAVITTGGLLKSNYVIHTVGPVWNGGNNDEDKLLSDCYINSLKLAEANDIKTIAFPNISTGIYKFPKERAVKIAIKAVTDFLNQNASIEKVIFVCFDEENYQLYADLITPIKKQLTLS
ncbi:MAG: O-acetyl-ADP-ribose deacetylase [Bacillota bacterium]